MRHFGQQAGVFEGPQGNRSISQVFLVGFIHFSKANQEVSRFWTQFKSIPAQPYFATQTPNLSPIKNSHPIPRRRSFRSIGAPLAMGTENRSNAAYSQFLKVSGAPDLCLPPGSGRWSFPLLRRLRARPFGRCHSLCRNSRSEWDHRH